jgi:perosamine synthetase
MISLACPLFGFEEGASIQRVLASGQLAQGENVAAFERRFAQACQVRDAVALSSGTAALHLALLAHGIGAGDEVITTAFSFAATANVILLVGATPVFVDIEPDTYTIDAALVEAAITARTKAILPVHLYGHPCDLKRLVPLAEAYNIALIEDACQAHAAKIDGKPVGGFGTGCFSFYATKNITTGEGGMVTTNDPKIAERVRLLRNHGQRERYYHTSLGYNLRMTEMQGALGLVQLEKLEQFTERRMANAAFLTERLRGAVQTPIERPGYRHVYHQYTIRISKHRDEFAAHLQKRGIGTAIHYPLAIHQQPFYRSQLDNFKFFAAPEVSSTRNAIEDVRLPVTELAAKQVLSLPVHPALSGEDLNTIAREVLALCS